MKVTQRHFDTLVAIHAVERNGVLFDGVSASIEVDAPSLAKTDHRHFICALFH
ncbi:MAG: hypothetical protein ACU4EQ_05440 [Candidatus Nitrosoglobus sp.]